MSMIPILFSRIQACLALAKSEHLSNLEECELTAELVGHFNKLNRYVLTFPEKQLIRRRLALFRKKTPFNLLHKHLIQRKSFSFKWHTCLSFLSNVFLNMGNRLRSQALLLTELDIKRWLSKSDMSFGDSTYYYILTPFKVNQSMLSPMFSDLIQKIALRDMQSIVLPTTWLHESTFDVMLPYFDTCILKGLECIIFDLTLDTYFDDIMHLIHLLLHKFPHIQSGISINLNNRYCIKQVEDIFNCLDTSCHSRFILRLSNGNFLHNDVNSDDSMDVFQHHGLKDCVFSKWSLYTILKRLKTEQIRCHIRCHYLYDLAWGLIIRSNLFLENRVFFESDILNYPHLGKLLYMLNKASVHRRPYIPDLSYMDSINTALSHLRYRSCDYNARLDIGSEPFLFEASHRRFFKYLSKDFLSYYQRSKLNV
jgi:hypothetical protein